MIRLLWLLVTLPFIALYVFVTLAVRFFGLRPRKPGDGPPLVVTGPGGAYTRQWMA